MKAKRGIALTVLFTVAVAAALWLHFRPRDPGQQVYRIGWMLSPPFQVRGEGGKPTGLAIDLVAEAARRRGIKLQWSFWQSSSESALRTKSADLWPLITITPERLKSFHITQPYLEAEYALLVREDSRYRTAKDLANATISLANASIDSWQLQGHLPGAHPVARSTPQATLSDVCEQRSDAAFMDGYTAISALLNQSACANHQLRWIAAPEIRSRLGIGATFEARAAADAIREEIGAMAGEGKLAPVLAEWGFMTGQQLESMEALLDARRRETRLTAVAALFGFLLLLTGWQAFRILHQRNHARETERVLRQTEQRLRLMASNLKEMVLAYDMSRKLIYANPAVETLTGYSVEDLERETFINWIHPDDQPTMLARWDTLFQGGSFEDVEYRLLAKDGRVKWAAASWGPFLDASGRQVGVQGSERDITEHRALQEQYLQAQKLESVGRLAGGVAHDFNNLLTVISGYSDIVFRSLSQDDPLRPGVDEIRKAGTRAADLTRQLLAFSRKQISQPKLLDLNLLVADSQKMLHRLLSEDIALVTRLSPSLSPVMADPGQIHQVLMNLAVNARDAMPAGGSLIIGTSDVEIDAGGIAEHPEVTPGPYVLLSVSDTGQGMDRATMAHIFEPFFTTKEIGKGTGLGLSTVYGIVRQSQGWICASSEPGHGATFKVYLPRTDGRSAAVESKPPGVFLLRASETVLVVEDQNEVRGLAIEILRRHGYRVLDAESGTVALAVAVSEPAPIDLLVTDVVMPGMNGRELAERMKRLRPEMKVLFTSGYTRDVIDDRGGLANDVAYIAKPYTPDEFAAKVRDVLASPRQAD